MALNNTDFDDPRRINIYGELLSCLVSQPQIILEGVRYPQALLESSGLLGSWHLRTRFGSE